MSVERVKILHMTTRLPVLLLVGAGFTAAQQRNPVQWSLTPESLSAPPGATVTVKVTAKLEDGWHIYALTNPEGGPTPTTIKLNPPNPAIAGIRLLQPKPETKFDANFNMNVEVFEREVAFLAAVEVAKEASPGDTEVSLLVRYQACTDKECLPRKTTLTSKLKIDPKAQAAVLNVPPGYTEFTGPTKTASAPPPPARTAEDQGLAAFLAIAFGFGLAAIFTPCVFPMIPITLSFFLKRPGVSRGESLRQALLFCLGIVVLFTGMGLAVTAIVGPFGVVQLGSNPWVNAFIAVVFIVFGLSLLGAFEITLPSTLLTRMDQVSQRGGILGTLLMGLTFSLTSFACVGPFVGTLLAGSVQRGGIQPVLGMTAFAAGLASPFFLLAMFPAYLQRLPRSGGWLARVKVVLGFIILAAALKYLSSIDQVLQWNILTRERFLAAWFVLFALPGLYLLGLLRLEGIRQDETLGVGRTLAGAAFLIFSLSLLPGMFGAPLGELDSWVPLASESPVALAREGGEARSLQWSKNDFDSALNRAKQENKLVLVAFTGYACTNCHWMKANMFTRAEVADAMKNFVLVELYTDGTDAASEANQKLQESKFGTVAIPYYAIFDADGRVVATFAGLTRKTPDYLAFLRSTPAAQTAGVRLTR
jgi:thiol:disulfide interchange protein DsbD